LTHRRLVLRASSRAVLGKSANKFTRVYFMAEPIPRALAADLELATSDAERRAVLLKHRFSAVEAKRVLAFGGVSALLLDRTTGVSVAPIADSMVQAFKELADNGVLAQQQPLVGVALVLVDCRYHADAKHRGPGDVVPPTMRAMSGALLESQSLRLLEPELRCDVNCEARVTNDVYAVLHRRGAVCGGAVSGSVQQESRFVTISGTISVRQSIGIVGDLRGQTKGNAFAAVTPLGWRLVASDPTDAQSDAAQVRERARVCRADSVNARLVGAGGSRARGSRAGDPECRRL
jgi:elongation factor 2